MSEEYQKLLEEIAARIRELRTAKPPVKRERGEKRGAR